MKEDRDGKRESGIVVRGVRLFARTLVVKGCEAHEARGTRYLTRFRLAESAEDSRERGGWGLYVHIFHRSDVAGIEHDHPWSFETRILRSGYVEEVPLLHPLWATRPELAQMQAAIIARTPRASLQPNAPGGPGGPILRPCSFYNRWTHGCVYALGALVPVRGVVWELVERQPLDPHKEPSAENGWRKVSEAETVLLDIVPGSTHFRPAEFVHRVRLRKGRDGREIPAVTLVRRGPRSRSWGFWRGITFQPSKKYFEENGC